MIRPSSIAAIAVLVGTAALSGCGAVRPWERGILAKPQMALDPYPLQDKYTNHNHGSREAAAGSGSAGGGGCGCY